MTVTLVRGDAAHLPLPNSSVDLIVTSPPYFALRSYQDNGGHYGGQIGSEATPGEFIDALIACTREWVRVLKPSGSLWVNLGDKYAGVGGSNDHGWCIESDSTRERRARTRVPLHQGRTSIAPAKSLMGLPWRYALRCIDDLGLILRAEVVWSKPNGLPESVTDRVRRSHEQWFHFTRQPRYYAAVDMIREPHAQATYDQAGTDARRLARDAVKNHKRTKFDQDGRRTYTPPPDPLGKLPGSVWSIPSQPLTVPPELGVDHFAAFPMEWPRRIIQGWSPSGICTVCGEGRRPVTSISYVPDSEVRPERVRSDRERNVRLQGMQALGDSGRARPGGSDSRLGDVHKRVTVTGECCGCTPYTDHPGSGERSPIESSRTSTTGRHGTPWMGSPHHNPVGPWREYHEWTPPLTRPAIVLDPFSGTGTVALMADVLGRHGIGVDMSQDYSRLARWRTSDPGERARAMQVEKPESVLDGQMQLFA